MRQRCMAGVLAFHGLGILGYLGQLLVSQLDGVRLGLAALLVVIVALVGDGLRIQKERRREGIAA